MKDTKRFWTNSSTYGWLLAIVLGSLPLLHGFNTAALIALMAVAAMSLRFHKGTWHRAYWVPLGFFLLILGSYFWSIEPDRWGRGVERELALVLVPLCFAAMPTLGSQVRDRALYGFAVALAGFAVFFIALAGVKYAQTSDASVFFYHELVSFFDLNAIYISTMVSLSLLYVLFWKKLDAKNLILIGVLSTFLILLSSKNLIITTLLTGIVGFFVVKKFRRRYLLFLSGGLLLLAGIFYASPLRQRMSVELTSNINEVLYCEDFTRIYPWTGSSIRLFQSRVFLELMQEDQVWMLGYGINASQEKIREKHLKYNLYRDFHNYNFHNQYLQAFAELGVFGFLFIVLFLAMILNGYRQSKDLMLLFFFVIMLAVFFTESYLWRHRGLLHFLVLYCLLFKTQPSRLQSST